jgi:hypothetical protein
MKNRTSPKAAHQADEVATPDNREWMDREVAVDHNEVVTDSELKTSIRVGGAKRPFRIMYLRVAH